MTQISKYPLRKEIESRMYEIFLDTLASVSTRTQVLKLIQDWLSPTERVMLAKRLSIALLLLKKYDQRSISKLIHVGLETVSKVSGNMKHGEGGYEMVLKSFLKQKKADAFWEKVDELLADLMPPHRNWSHWRKDRWDEKVRKKKAF